MPRTETSAAASAVSRPRDGGRHAAGRGVAQAPPVANFGPGTPTGSQFFLAHKDSQMPPDHTVFGAIQADGWSPWIKSPKAASRAVVTPTQPSIEVAIKSVLLG